ncbi:tripartite ATP-independent transporter DctP family solute receptor [Sinobaca qinghaiensis]|uniref:Tripartite ATP-independent transporter DctP family solute receptor n=1 Tax=Sinobaca qinghaiensis TaxID=342944 RepID=A0A419V8C9_9BACL|nr:C4-dicarboxylate TRAP transporter substrate-binding protein [Sinobaca qinghaiensis]RKD76325.1 tripartite ATP-independent transporter DctP family solute receptor [Sinobaca qinghaiensis]
MKKFLPLVALGSTLVIAGCGGGESESSGSEEGGGSPSHELQVGIVVSESDPMYEGLESFKENVEERTDGDLAIEIFPDSSLGDTAEIQEQAIAGANVGTLADAGIMADYSPEIGILQGPYLFENYEDIQKVTDSDLFAGWEEDLSSSQNLQILSFNWYQGARHMVTNNAINTPEDMNGQSIRTIGADVFLETIEAMGANPTGLDWAEVYPGIQQGVIDGAEAQHSATYGASLYEVADHISKTNHIQLITGLVVGAEWFSNLPEDYQTIVTEEAEAAGIEASNTVIEGEEEYEGMMEEEGMTIVEPDLEPFQEATEGVYEKFENYPEIREEIMTITEN